MRKFVDLAGVKAKPWAAGTMCDFSFDDGVCWRSVTHGSCCFVVLLSYCGAEVLGTSAGSCLCGSVWRILRVMLTGVTPDRRLESRLLTQLSENVRSYLVDGNMQRLVFV